MLERSEPSLYAISQELCGLQTDIEVVPVLGSATNAPLVQRCFQEHGVEVVFHVAAYKHVPLVEANPLAGLTNNVLGTRIVCEASRLCGLRQLVLISTDKAVRPTSVMGASKRLAELYKHSRYVQHARWCAWKCAGFRQSVVPVSSQIASGGSLR